MSRRSARLASGGYNNSDEESDSSSVTNISYHERPVRAFKKAGNRKANAEPAVSTDQHEGPTPPSPPTRRPKQTARTAPYTSTATPRPALNPRSTRSRTPTAPQGRSPSRPASHRRLHGNEPGQNNVDSSGYSSSEGSYRTPADATGNGGKDGSASGAASAGHSSGGRPFGGMANVSFSSRTKKTLGLFLLLIVLILSVWLLLPLLTSLISRTAVTVTPPQTEPPAHPASPASAPPPPSAGRPAPALDPAAVSAIVHEKMQNLMRELLVKQESLFSQMEERVLLDMMDMRAQLKAADSDGRPPLEKEAVAALSRQIADYQAGSQAASASLDLRIQAVEAQNAKLSQELSNVQLKPPPDPRPDPSPAPPRDQLTPELQQAVEKWLADHIKEQDLTRFGEKGTCSDHGRPVADKMADFALESQGASVVSTRCSETYYIRSACLTLFGFPLWYPSESPRTVIQGYPALLPGKCWAFHGVQGTLVISLSHPVRITHVTLDHLPRYTAPTGRIDSAPRDFEVYGMMNDSGEGALLGKFRYDQDGEPTQTFPLPSPSDTVHRFVELRILSNWGQVEYTCIYRFRVHGKIAST